MTLDERKKKVLQAIIQDYIATAEPVGSRTISRKYTIGVSPATIRNEMSDLEEMGYIEQPHTSAGRIPSQRGYRYYVDCLMQKEGLNRKEQEQIRRGYIEKVRDVGNVIQRTAVILSELTNYTSMVLGPEIGFNTFKHVQLVPLQETKALVVVVTDTGYVQNKLIELPGSISDQDLHKISQVLNAKLQGLSLDDIKLTLVKEIYSELTQYRHFFHDTLDLIQEALNVEPGERVCLKGTLSMLNQPEFRDINKVKTLLTLLEQEDSLRNLLAESVGHERGVTVKIGQENKLDPIKDCSMITATYQVDGHVIGSIGVLGPTRMEYAKVVSIVEFMTQNLSGILKDFYRKS